MNRDFAVLFVCLTFVMCATALAYCAKEALDQPEVHVSHKTKQCVRVVDALGAHRCPEVLPEKYDLVWVK